MTHKLSTLPSPWYAKGLSFQCTGCGHCCTGAPGYVWLTDEEITALASHLNLSREEFLHAHTRSVEGRISLNEDPGHYDCTFLKENQCTVYEVRPQQCRTFPWWGENLASPKAWRQASRECEGICSQAPTVSFEEIEAQHQIQEETNKRYAHD